MPGSFASKNLPGIIQEQCQQTIIQEPCPHQDRDETTQELSVPSSHDAGRISSELVHNQELFKTGDLVVRELMETDEMINLSVKLLGQEREKCTQHMLQS